jgi:hypothetical protein
MLVVSFNEEGPFDLRASGTAQICQVLTRLSGVNDSD